MGMARETGVASRMFRALANQDINLQMITTSEIKISVLVDRDQSLQALRTVHHEFRLDEGITETDDHDYQPDSKNKIDALEVIQRLQKLGMESLMIDDIQMDDRQSRVTLRGVPNKPGIAAAVFERIAAEGIFVDMIVQSYSRDKLADISFTVPRDQLDASVEAAEKIRRDFNCAYVSYKKVIAKLTVSGIGLRSHTGVAIGMFKALADAKINVEMINTSEVRVNVVVDGDVGQRGLDCLRMQFNKA